MIWRGRNWRVSNSPVEEDFEEEWEWREKNSRSSNFSSAFSSADTFSGSCEEPPHSDFGGSCWTKNGAEPQQTGRKTQNGLPMQVGQIIVEKTLLSRQLYRFGGIG